MFEDSFVDMLRKYPDATNDRMKFVGLMKDFFPGQQMQVNLINNVFDLGIVDEIAKESQIDNAFVFRFTKRLIYEYGITQTNAKWAVSTWCTCYGEQILHKTCNFDIKNSEPSLPASGAETDSKHDDDYLLLDRYAKLGEVVNSSAVEYLLSSTTEGYIISKYRGFHKPNLVVPNVIDGKSIIGIGRYAFANCFFIRTLTISDGIEFIEDGAFASCDNLEKVLLPTSLKRIGSLERPVLDMVSKGAFYGCAIRKIDLPGSVTYLGRRSFAECKSLAQIKLSMSITEIKEQTFENCAALSSVVLPVELIRIGENAFKNCSSLEKIRFPLSLRKIEQNAFAGCTSITAIFLNEGLTTIGRDAFKGCLSLRTFIMPSTVSRIEDYDYATDIFSINFRQNDKLIIYCYLGTYGLDYATKKGYPIKDAAELFNRERVNNDV